MPDRFGQGADYSQQFSYLADTYLDKLERDLEDAEQRREEEQAAKDTEFFARYEAGKVSGDQLLSYIRRRIEETAYDPKQQAEWKKALLEYQESIADGKALEAFQKSNDYNGYIAYLREKLGRMKGDPAERAQIQKQINDLIDQRDQQSVTRGAERILLQIAKGRASYADLLKFYRERLRDTRKGSPVRDQIRSQITEVAARVRSDSINRRMGDLASAFANHRMSAQEYGRALRDLARSSGLRESDPSTYNQLIERADQLINTVVDMGRIEQIEGMLQRGEITQQRAMTLIYREAERWKVSDPKTYQQLRNYGWEIGHKPPEPVPGQTPLPNPGVLGLPDDYIPNQGRATANRTGTKALKFITQLDGSEFAQVNCVMAATAMLAYAMGYREDGGQAISGGDLRYLTGDREMGTNLDQAEYALGRLGIGGLRNWNDRHMDFEKFKRRVGEHGQPAVLMGVYANMPKNLRASPGLTRGHGIFIAAYDAKKRAFLVYDPAVSKNSNPNYNGVWMSEAAIRSFGWGPSYTDSTGTYQFNGQVLLAPPNTLKGDFRAGNVQGPRNIRFVSVDDAPARRETPTRYKGLNHRGPSTVEPVGNETHDRRGRPRGNGGKLFGAEDTPDTVEEVRAALNAHDKQLELIGKLGSAFNQGRDRITIGGQEYILNDELMKQLDRETLDIFDKDILYAEAAGLESVLNDRFDARVDFLANVAARNSIEADTIINTAIRDASKDYQRALDDPDPDRAIAAAHVIKGRLQILNGVLQVGNLTNTPLDDLSEDPKVPGNRQSLDEIIALMDMVTEQTDVPISERMPDILQAMDRVGAAADEHNQDGSVKAYGNDLGNLVKRMLDQHDAKGRIDRGEAVPVIDGQTGRTGVVPLLPGIDPLTGEATSTPYFGEDENGPIKGIQVPVQTARGVELRWVRPGRTDPLGMLLIPTKDDKALGLVKGVPLTEAKMLDLEKQGVLTQMVGAGQLQEFPYTLPAVTMPSRKVNGRVVPGQTFIQDPSGGWFTGSMPVVNFGRVGGKYIGMREDMTPEFQWRPYSSVGMSPLPFQGERKAIQDAYDQGIIPPAPNVLGRGFDGEITDRPETMPKFHTPYDPLSSAYQPTVRVESPEDRAERLEKIVNDTLNLIRQKSFEEEYLRRQGREDEIGGVEIDDSGNVRTIGGGPTTAGPNGVYARQTPKPQNPPESAGPQPSRGDIPRPGGFDFGSLPDLQNLANLGRGLGVNIPDRALPDRRDKDDVYRPPKPMTRREADRRGLLKFGPSGKNTGKGGGLPRIGGSIMVGGTRIDLPSTNRTPPKQHEQRPYKPPSPNRPLPGTGGTGGANTGGGSSKRKKPSVNVGGAG